MGDKRGAYQVLVRKPEGRIPLENPRPTWEDNIKNRSSRSGMEVGMEWIDQGQDRDRRRALVNAVMNLRVP
jgi:hypothetical protein